MKKQILSVVLAIAATASLVGCSDNSGITINSSSTSVSSGNNSSADTSSANGSNNSTASSSSSNSNTFSSNTSETNNSSTKTSSDTSSSESGSATSPDDVNAVLNAPLPIVYKATAPVFEKSDENAPVPTSLELLKTTGANIDKSDSVIINAKLKGKTRHPKGYDPVPIEQNYTYVITKNATYLRVAHTDELFSPSVTAYEEYTVFNDDGTFSTITKSGDKWVATKSEFALTQSDAPNESKVPFDWRKEIIMAYNGSNLYENAITQIGLLRIFASDFRTKNRFGEDDMIVSMPIIRDNSKNLTLQIDEWYRFQSSDRFLSPGFTYQDIALNKFFRYASNEEIEWKYGYIPDFSWLTSGTSITHVIGNDYLLKDINGRFVTNDKDYDITFDFEFTDWDNIEKINVPDYVTE